MKRKKLNTKLIRYFLLLFTSIICSIFKLSAQKTKIAVPQSLKSIDIPKYPNGETYSYWTFTKQKQAQLGLSSPETSEDSVLIRIWITNPIGRKNQQHGLIEIKNDSTGWKGTLVLMRVDFILSKRQEKITESKKIELLPRSSWSSIVDSLYFFKIDILPTDDKIDSYYDKNNFYNNSASTFSFEFATKSQYRFYQYSNIYRAIDKYWQPKNVDAIFSLLDREFNLNAKSREYFK